MTVLIALSCLAIYCLLVSGCMQLPTQDIALQGKRPTGKRAASGIELDDLAMCIVGAADSMNMIILLH